MEESTCRILRAVRDTAPLVHNITNYVVMNSSANILLAVGASPVMAHSRKEVEEMTAMAGALVMNIGTLSEAWVDAMCRAGRKANECGIPVILDPVGAGATSYRTDSVRQILDQCRVSVLRGNASEILSLTDSRVKTRGVESSHGMSQALIDACMYLAGERNLVVSVSGAADLITDGWRQIRVRNGHPLMTRVTGTGCGLTAVTGAFCAAAPDDLLVSCGAAAGFYGLCGEHAQRISDKPGSFFTAFLDCLYSLTDDDLNTGLKMDVEGG